MYTRLKDHCNQFALLAAQSQEQEKQERNKLKGKLEMQKKKEKQEENGLNTLRQSSIHGSGSETMVSLVLAASVTTVGNTMLDTTEPQRQHQSCDLNH